MSSRTVYQRPDDPYIYLLVMGEWYCYDPTSTPLGSGAMGTVYLGYRVKDGTRMAIKRVKDSYSNNPMIRERAKQEASLAFRHNNLVEMIGYCEYAPDNGPIFLVSKYVAGKNIDEYAKEFLNGNDRVEKNAMLFFRSWMLWIMFIREVSFIETSNHPISWLRVIQISDLWIWALQE